MRRRRKKRSQLSVSLFPFLAVLICTLGVLIVMLVMAVKSADDQAAKNQSDDDAQKLAKIDELQESLDFQKFQIDGMRQVRPDAVARLNQSRAHRSYLQDEIRKLNQEFRRVGNELRELDQQPDPVQTDITEFSSAESSAELASLEQKIADAKTELQTKRKTARKTGPETFVIVPHKGGGGTFRRPIFIECTKDAITLQPAGIQLAKTEFVPPLEPGNMLDSALLTIREYWQRYDLAGSEGSPYPLIVVRPDGAETFVLARHAMKSWDDEFGYELVESDKTLDFGTRDPQLETEINQAIEEARRRQRYQMAHIAALQQRAARFASAGSRPGLTASGRAGGFVSTAGGIGHENSIDAGHRRGLESGAGTERAGSEFQDSETSYAAQAANQDNNSKIDNSNPTGSNSQSNSRARSAQKGNLAGDSSVQNPYEDLSIAKQRGKNWALPTQTPGATGYVRPIRIVCDADYLEIYSAGRPPKQIPMRGATSGVIDPMIDEIWKQIDSWGVSGVNGYWKPQLRITVLPGGNKRFSELKGLLDQSGLTVEESRP